MQWFLLVGLLVSSNDPYHLRNSAKLKHVKSIVEYSQIHNQDPYELLAIAWTESRFKPRAVSVANARGLFQVMCKHWYKPLHYKTITKCNESLFNPQENIKAGVFVLATFRKKYEQCKGDLAYRCYYGGQRWNRRTGKLAKKIERYEKKVRESRIQLHTYYKDLIEGIRSRVKKRS